MLAEYEKVTINELLNDFDEFLENIPLDNSHKEFSITFGLCSNIFDRLEDRLENTPSKIEHISHEVLEDIFKSWPHYSGCVAYPVPYRKNEKHDKRVSNAIELKLIQNKYYDVNALAYTDYYNLYDKNTDYGKLRIDLYNHLKDNILTSIEKCLKAYHEKWN